MSEIGTNLAAGLFTLRVGLPALLLILTALLIYQTGRRQIAGSATQSLFNESWRTTMKNKWEHISGQWKQFSGEAKKRWGQLTDDEIAQIDGNRKTLTGLLQKRYSIAKKEADKQIDAWAATLKV